jgi:hypothetical protein
MKKFYILIPLVLAIPITVAATTAVMKLTGRPRMRDDTSVIVGGIERIARLVTAEYRIPVYVHASRKNTLWAHTEWYAKVTGTVTAGVNLNKAKINVSGKDRLVSIELAPGAVEVSNPRVAIGDIVLKAIQDPVLFCGITASDYSQAQDSAVVLIRRTAEQNGIANRARKHAEDLLREFVSRLGYHLNMQNQGG